MKILISIIILNFLFFNFIFADDPRRIGTEVQFPIFSSNIQIDNYNSIGFSDISKSQISEIGSTNPACLAKFSGITAGLNFQYNEKTQNIADIEVERPKQYLPSTFGVVYPKNDLRIALSYHKKYSSFYDLGRTEITSINQPDGTGEFFEASNENIVHSPSVLCSYSFFNQVFENDQLTLGSQIYYDYWIAEDKIFNTTATLKTGDISYKIGLLYDYTSEFGLGILFEKGIDLEGEVKVSSNLQSLDPIDTTGYYVAIPQKYFKKFRLPDKASIGIHKQFWDKVRWSSNFTLVFWNSYNKVYEDQLDFSSSLHLKITENISGVYGLYFTDVKIKENESYYRTPLHATYFNIGIQVKFENLVFITEFLDTSAQTAEFRKQSIYKFNINYTFD